MRYDPDGNIDYVATVSTNKSGTVKTVTVDVVYAVIDLSSKDVHNAGQLKGDGYQTETFSGSFSEKINGKDVTVNVVTNVSYRLVTNLDQVRDGENVAIIVDDVQRQSLGKVNEGSDPVGMAELLVQQCPSNLIGWHLKVLYDMR